jgi:anion-transporting  ArsA/GET3 family ATPase
VLADIGTFVVAIDTTFGGFRERADATYAQLKERGTAFVVVATPEPDALREAAYFVERLRAEDMPLAGLVVNRVQQVSTLLGADQATAAAQELEATGATATEDGRITAALLREHAARIQMAERQEHVIGRFTAAHPMVAVARVPALPEDVHDLAGLRRIGELL